MLVTSKVVSKAEGRRPAPGDAATRRARRAETRPGGGPARADDRIVRTRHGLTLAAAGVDASNVDAGQRACCCPVDPDASARGAPRRRSPSAPGANVGVVVTDTAGRAWRDGPDRHRDRRRRARASLETYAGRTDGYGNPLAVTAPARGRRARRRGRAGPGQARPAGRSRVVRGRADLVLPAGEDGPGAAALVRAEGEDLFGFGAREAVRPRPGGSSRPTRRPFGAPAAAEELAAPPSSAGASATVGRGRSRSTPAVADRSGGSAPLAFAHGWQSPRRRRRDRDVRLRPVTPLP